MNQKSQRQQQLTPVGIIWHILTTMLEANPHFTPISELSLSKINLWFSISEYHKLLSSTNSS